MRTTAPPSSSSFPVSAAWLSPYEQEVGIVPSPSTHQDSQKVPGKVNADDLIAVLEKALNAKAQLPTPESAGFAPDAIRDFLTFVDAHGGFEVPISLTENAQVHYGSLMGGLVIGAVAARQALLSALLSDEVIDRCWAEVFGEEPQPEDFIPELRAKKRVKEVLQAAIKQVGGGS
jgi:hypothetical protein